MVRVVRVVRVVRGALGVLLRRLGGGNACTLPGPPRSRPSNAGGVSPSSTPHTTDPSSSASHQASVFAKLLPSLAADADELAALAEGADAMRRAQRMV